MFTFFKNYARYQNLLLFSNKCTKFEKLFINLKQNQGFKMSMNFKKYFTNFLKMFFDYRNVRRLKKIVLKHVHKLLLFCK